MQIFENKFEKKIPSIYTFKYTFVVCVCFFIFNCNIFAQERIIKKYSEKDGLPSLNLYAIFQDSYGFIWVGGETGVIRFDGNKFVRFSTQDGLPQNSVWDFFEDSKRRIWFRYHGNSLTYYDHKSNTFNQISPKEPNIIFGPEDKFCDSGDSLFVIRNRMKYYYFDDKNSSLVRIDKFIKIEKVPVLDGIYVENTRYRDKIIHKTYYINPSNRFSDLVDFEKLNENSSDNYYVRKNILYTSHNGKWAPKYILPKIPVKILHKIKDKLIFIYKDNSSQIMRTDFTDLKDNDLFVGLDIYDFLEDAEGNYWVVTRNDGILYISKPFLNASVFNHENSELKNDKIVSIATDSKGNIWMATMDNYIYNIDSKDKKIRRSIEPLYPTEGKVDQRITNIIYEPVNNMLVVSCDKDIVTFIHLSQNLKSSNTKRNVKKRLTFNNGKSYPFDMHYTKNIIKNISVDSEHVYISMINECEIYNYHNKTGTFFGKLIRYYSVIEDNQQSGTYFIGTINGLQTYSKNKGFHKALVFNDYYGVLDEHVSNLVQCDDGTVVVAINGKGLYIYNNNLIFAVPQTQNYNIKHLYYIDGKIWAATDNGVVGFTVTTSGNIMNFQLINDTKGLETIDVQDLCITDKKLYAATNKGLYVINNFEDKYSISKPKCYLNKIKVMADDQPINVPLELKYNKNFLSFEFIGLSYSALGKIDYYYNMVGLDNVMHQRDEPIISYTSIPPGEYAFKVMAHDFTNDVYSDELVIPIKVNYPFWRTWTFSITSFLMGGFLIYYFVKRREKRLLMEKDKAMSIERKFSELELQALQAQLNPHFIFNALQSIQLYITTSNTVQANHFLTSFAKLMRHFLEASKQKFITLEAELKMIEMYMEIEQLRYGKEKLYYEIDVEKGIDTDDYQVPSLLLQTFVENAINHGIKYKIGRGTVAISVKTNELNQLEITIKDDGIGREKAEQIKQVNSMGHQSRGLEILMDRLSTIKSIEKLDISVKFNDIVGPDNSIQGTQVDILLK
ncbi:MAG: histidine kinase [Saprospiraceae bacterium]|nr:histidine kinase [Saprospiraceae bacterium]